MAGENQITVRIVADVSEMKAGTQEAAQAAERLGSDVEKTSGHFLKMERSMAHVTTHMVGHMIPGMGRMTRSIGQMGETALGIGPFLAVMIPVAALVAGIMIMEKLEAVALKDATALADTAVETTKLNDKLRDSKEKLAGLVEGPMSEAVLKLKDFKDRESELGSVLKANEKVIDAQTSKWSAYVEWVQRATDAAKAYATGGGIAGAAAAFETGAMSNNELKTRIQLIIQNRHTNKELTEGMRELQGIMNQLASAAGPHSAEQMKAVEQAMLNLKIAAEKAKVDEEALAVEAKSKKEKNAAENITILKGEVTQSKNLWAERVDAATEGHKRLEEIDKAKISIAETVPTKTLETVENEKSVKMAAAQAEYDDTVRINGLKVKAAQVNAAEEIKIKKEETEKKIAVAMAGSDEEKAKIGGMRLELADEVKTIESTLHKDLEALRQKGLTDQQAFETKKTEIANAAVKGRQEVDAKAFREKERQLEDETRATERALSAAMRQEAMKKKTGGMFESAAGGDTAMNAAIAATERQIEKAKALMEQADADEIESATEKYNALVAKAQEYRDKKEAMDLEIAQHNRASIDKMTNAFNSGFMSWMQGGETFGRAMQKVWQSMASAALSSIMKAAEAQMIGLRVRTTVAQEEKIIDAKSAAAGAYKSVVGIPIVGPILAPIAAGVAFAAVASFAAGGVMEHEGGAMLHKNEMVLPPHLSSFVQNAAKNATAGSEKGGDQFSFYQTNHIHAMDRNGMEDALREHGDTVFKLVQSEMRRRNV